VAVPGGLADADIKVTLNLTAAESANGAVRVGQTVLMADNATGLIVQKGLVQKVTNSAGTKQDELEVKLYGTATNALPTTADAINLYVYGSEFGKGSIGMEGSIEPGFTQYANRPMILKDKTDLILLKLVG